MTDCTALCHRKALRHNLYQPAGRRLLPAPVLGLSTAVCLAVCTTASTSAGAQELAAEQLASLSLEQLSNVRITSVSRTEQKLSSAAAAVAVVSDEDIRRSGATTVPEALRMVPGVHVAQENANTWAVSARGFSSANSRNLLVLSDTRSIYTPLFSGVFWDAQDYLMEDIDRIEVIRGPGASMWGSNAVNGVVSITTKDAEDTQGLYTEALLGTEERGAAVRYGGELADEAHYRVFAKHSSYDSSYAPALETSDDWSIDHLGFRTDWDATGRDAVTVQGDVYQGEVGDLVPSVRLIGQPGPQGNLESDISGGNILGRWTHTVSSRSDFELRAYYDQTFRDDPTFEDRLETFDVDFQHRLEVGSRHELMWGANYRVMTNENRGKGIFDLEPDKSTDKLVSVFVQDQIMLAEGLELTVGSKFEHNDFSGFEVQPTLRAAWDPLPNHTAWAAISRAVRVPTRYERDVSIDAAVGPNGEIYRLVGNEDFESEEMLAYEAGYRWHGLDAVSVDLAVFHNRYDEVSSVEMGEPFVEGEDQVVVPLVAKNMTDGRAQGLEALVTYTPLSNWRLITSYSYLDMHLESGGMDINFEELLEGSTPRHQLGLISRLDWRDYQVDVHLRHHSEIRSIPEIRSGETIPAYTEMNIRVARRFGEHLEVSLVGENLLDDSHPEFGHPDVRGEVERSIYGKVAVRF